MLLAAPSKEQGASKPVKNAHFSKGVLNGFFADFIDDAIQASLSFLEVYLIWQRSSSKLTGTVRSGIVFKMISFSSTFLGVMLSRVLRYDIMELVRRDEFSGIKFTGILTEGETSLDQLE